MSTPPSPFSDLAAFTGLARVTALALSADGSRLVAAVEAPDEMAGAYVSAIWDIDPDGRSPATRLTHSEVGESSPVFRPDGSLLFVSKRGGDEAAIWSLPQGGEATVVGRYPGGLAGPVVAAGTGAVLGRCSRPVAATDDGAATRSTRADRKITAVLHTGMPVRHWDHELGDLSTRLAVIDAGSGADSTDPDPVVVDIAGDARLELTEASYDISADGTTVVTTWTRRRRHGRTQTTVAVVDVATGARRLLDVGPDAELAQPRLSPDGRRVALRLRSEGDFTTITTSTLQLRDLHDDRVVDVELGEIWDHEHAWSPDGATLYVTGDWHGRGAVVAVDAGSGRITRRLASDASYANLCVAPDGASIYALRSAVDVPPAPVRLDVTAEDQKPTTLPSPAERIGLPGSLHEIETTAADGAGLRSWLCLPEPAGEPAPAMVWIHGGPFSSWNSWSWRWNPWTAVARGYAVVLPDPALSTGYGPGWLSRAWPHRAEPVWRDVETVLDAVLARPDVDAERVAALGGSFGGYMTNWIAGHTERFRAIVTHAGLWALDQQHATTDMAEWKTGLFDTPAEHPEWYAENSPNRFLDAIVTPMLVVHGSRDYRVPISEALRLWWDLVSHFDGEPDDLPHRFLQFTSENHWVLSPSNSRLWYETVLAFCDLHVRGRSTPPSTLV